MRADQGLAGVAFRADRTKDPGGAETVIPPSSGAMPLCVPDPGQPALLADPAFVGKPQLQRLVGVDRPCDLGQLCGEVFLNAARAWASDRGWHGRADIQVTPSRLSSRYMPLAQ